MLILLSAGSVHEGRVTGMPVGKFQSLAFLYFCFSHFCIASSLWFRHIRSEIVVRRWEVKIVDAVHSSWCDITLFSVACMSCKRGFVVNVMFLRFIIVRNQCVSFLNNVLSVLPAWRIRRRRRRAENYVFYLTFCVKTLTTYVPYQPFSRMSSFRVFFCIAVYCTVLLHFNNFHVFEDVEFL